MCAICDSNQTLFLVIRKKESQRMFDFSVLYTAQRLSTFRADFEYIRVSFAYANYQILINLNDQMITQKGRFT